MSTSIPARLVDSILGPDDDIETQPKAGDFKWCVEASDGPKAGMLICCPGCCVVCHLPFEGKSTSAGAKWHWNGNEDLPTLSPSIHHVGCWHGYLTDGMFVSC